VPERKTAFAAAYVINLARSAERWETMQPVLARMSLLNVIRFPATDGYALSGEDLRRLQDSGRLSSDLTEFDEACRQGEIGCALSHAAVLRDIVEQGWPDALILEDDVVLAGNPDTWLRRFRKAFADVPPTWELWYLYRCLDVRHRTQRVTRRTAIPWLPLGGAAYAVTQEGARKLLAAMTPTASAVDRVYAELVKQRGIDAWAASPRLILPGAHTSIINRANPSKRWVENGVNLPPEFWPREFLEHLGEQDPHPRVTQLRVSARNAREAVRRAFTGGHRPAAVEPRAALPSAAWPHTVFMAVWWFADSGGMERHVTDLAVALARQGVHVIVLSELHAPRSNQYVRELREAGVRILAPGWLLGQADRVGTWKLGKLRDVLERLQRMVHRLRRGVERAEWTPDDEEILGSHSFHPLTRFAMRGLARAASASRPDAIHLHGCRFGQSWVVEWAASHGLPSVYTEHTTMDDWGGPFEAEGAETAGRYADVLACVSERARAAMRSALPRPRAIEISRHIIHGPAKKARAGKSKTPLPARILSVARLAHHKGLDVLLEALGMLHARGVEFALQIAGEGPQRAELEQLAVKRGIAGRVDFLGEVPHSMIADLWEEADIGVLSSRTEGLPLSVVEAMAHGRVVVASRVGGIPEVICHEENGLLVAAEDAEGLRDSLLRLIQDPALRARLATEARRSFETGGWSEPEVASRVLSMYEQARERRALIEEIRRRGGVWLREKKREALAGLRRVYLVLEDFKTSYLREQHVVERAVALASNGVEVAILSGMPVYWNSRHSSRLRRAGVRVYGPSRIELWRRRFITDAGATRLERGANIAARRLAQVLEAKCGVHRPDAIHIYGKQGSPCGAVAEVRGIAVVYTESEIAEPLPRHREAELQREWAAELRGIGEGPGTGAGGRLDPAFYDPAFYDPALELSAYEECRELMTVLEATQPYRQARTGEAVTGGDAHARR